MASVFFLARTGGTAYRKQNSDITGANRFLQDSDVACILQTLTGLRRHLCKARSNWSTEWRSVVSYNKRRFTLGAIEGRVLVRLRPGDLLQTNRLRNRNTGSTPMVSVSIFYYGKSTPLDIPRNQTANFFVSLVIQSVLLSFM